MTRTELRELARLTAIELMKLMNAQRQAQPKAPAEGYLTRKQAAEYLGCSVETLRRRPDVPCIKNGRRYLYTRESLSAWAENR